MADSSDHEERRRILKRSKKWTKNNHFNIVSQRDYYDQVQEACEILRKFENEYSKCIEYVKLRRRQWTEEERRKTTSTTTHKYWYPGGYEYGQTTSPPFYAMVTRPPLPPPVVDQTEPPASSHDFDSLTMVQGLMPLTLSLSLFFMAAACFYVITECFKERKLASVQRRPQDVQTTPLLPGARRETQQSTVRRASHEPLRTANSRPNNNDLPPPYSECVRSDTGKSEEPPPRYSACFQNLEDAEPQVHTRRQNVFAEQAHSSTDIGNENGIRAKSLATSSNQSENIAPRRRAELVFDTSRIV